MNTLFWHTIVCITLLAWSMHNNACDGRNMSQQTDTHQTCLTSTAAKQMQEVWQLHNAAKNKNMANRQGCINIGGFAQVKNRHGETPLQIAAVKKYYQAAQILIDHGAEVDESAVFPPLHIAAKHGDAKIARLLLRSGADADKLNYKKETPLLIAIVHGHTQTALLLIQNGANPNLPNMQAACLTLAATDKKNPLIQPLLHAGASLNMCGQHNETALHIAIMFENYLALQDLIEYGSNLKAETVYGDSAHSIALHKRDNQRLADHLEAIDNANKSMPDNIKPVDIPWYINQGAQITAIFDKGSMKTKHMLLDDFRIYAYLHQNQCRIKQDMYNKLIKEKPTSWLFFAIQCNHRKTLLSLLKKYPISPNKPTDRYGNQLLHYAARYNRKDITHDLLRLGTIEQLSYQDNDGMTPDNIAQKYHPKTIGKIITDEKIRYQLLKKFGRASFEMPAEMIEHILSYTHVQKRAT